MKKLVNILYSIDARAIFVALAALIVSVASGSTAAQTVVQHTVTLAGSGEGIVRWAEFTPFYAGEKCGIGNNRWACSKTFDAGTDHTLLAEPEDNWVFDGWSGGGCSGMANPCTIKNLDNDVAVTANFIRQDEVPRIMEISRDGTVLPDDSGGVDFAGYFEWTASPTLEYTIKNTGSEDLHITRFWTPKNVIIDNNISITDEHGAVIGQADTNEPTTTDDPIFIGAGDVFKIRIKYKLRNTIVDPNTSYFKEQIVGERHSFTLEIEYSDSRVRSVYDLIIVTHWLSPDMIAQRTSRIIRNFMNRRADMITANEPDLTSRLTQRKGGGDRVSGSFSLNGDDLSTRMKFSAATSLSRLTQPPSMPLQRGGLVTGAAVAAGAAVDRFDPLPFGSGQNGSNQNNSGQNNSSQNGSGQNNSRLAGSGLTGPGANAILPNEQTYGLVSDPDAPIPQQDPQADAIREFGLSSPGAEPPADPPADNGTDNGTDNGPAFDVWMKASFAYHDGDDDGNGTASSGLLFLGADYLVNESAVFGMLAQFDWMEEETKVHNYKPRDTETKGYNHSLEGVGWMAGPYFVKRLRDNMLFDARLAYGQSSNDIRPLGTYEDTFDTTRWMARAQLSGQTQIRRLSVQPHIRVLYFEETQEAYTDSSFDQMQIPEQTISLGRVSFGPTFSFRHTSDSRVTYQPRFGIQGLWDFDPADQVTLDSDESYVSTKEVRARVEAGLTVSREDGYSISVSSFYDGIGVEHVESLGGSFTVNIPLN